jgi:hypothetical protein
MIAFLVEAADSVLTGVYVAPSLAARRGVREGAGSAV